MGKNTGTLIGAPIRPNDSLDAYPVALQAEIKGGHHTRATIAARNAMGTWLREQGMTCFVQADGNTYELAADLVTWTLVKSANGGSTGPGTGGDSSTVTIISGNFGVWAPLDNYSDFVVDQIEVRYKTDLQAFASRAITYLQGQFSLPADFVATDTIIGILPLNSRPSAQIKKYMITNNIEMFLVIETTGEVKLISKDGFNLPADNADQPYYIDTFFKPVIVPVEAEVFTATRMLDFSRNDCGTGYHGSPVSFSKQYQSTIDQDTANALAAADENFNSEGQAFANDPANGSTCEIDPGFTISNSFSKPIKLLLPGNIQYNINYQQSRSFNVTGVISLSVDINIPGASVPYWVINSATYDPDDETTYQTGLLFSGGTSNVAVSGGDLVSISMFKPIIAS